MPVDRFLWCGLAFSFFLYTLYVLTSVAAHDISSDEQVAVFASLYQTVVVWICQTPRETMHLVERNDAGEFSLIKDFVSDSILSYAILSHTWGLDSEEIIFEELIDGTGKDKCDYMKIWFCEEQVRCDDLQHFWVDICCINKSNNTELLKAINSMFCWYCNVTKCYVYLLDVLSPLFDANDRLSWLSCELAFWASRWFTCGWMLQELLVSCLVEFFFQEDNWLDDKRSLE